MATATETRAQEELLHDYDIHLSTSAPHEESGRQPNVTSFPPEYFPNCPPNYDAPRPHVENPPNWTNDWRQVPPYRPTNTNLDINVRPMGTNPGEIFFLFHMFTGVSIEATSSWIWGSTIGKFNKSLWRFKIGGEI